jgi:hypothetical protein
VKKTKFSEKETKYRSVKWGQNKMDGQKSSVSQRMKRQKKKVM